MRGTIKQRAKGSWTIILDTGRDPATCKRQQKWETVRGTKKEAVKRLAELQHQLNTGEYIKGSKDTVDSFLERWLRDYAWPNLSPETAQGYDIICRKHLIPALGNLELTKVTPDVLQAYYAKALKQGRRDGKGGLSPRTVRHHHTTLHTALAHAVKWRLLARNPADAVDAPRYQKKEMRVFDQSGMGAFLESIKESEYYPLFYSSLYTGVRRSELLALRWCDVDLDMGTISINRSLHQLADNNFIFQAPKTAKSRRLVALPPSATIVLRKHREVQSGQGLLLGIPVTEESLVFCHHDGSPLLPHNITNVWKRLVKQAGFQGIRLHDARHTHATLMLSQGVHPKVVQERLGHANISMTLDTYSHVLPGLQEAAALRLDQASTPPSRSVEVVSSG
ncbi:MAG TPA: tyrosine-type recombinase/integrase [Dehalococcoidia bacterium]|nr:tyrosine-type recombinase/integrase [Dehalococcoidia bacterium]